MYDESDTILRQLCVCIQVRVADRQMDDGDGDHHHRVRACVVLRVFLCFLVSHTTAGRRMARLAALLLFAAPAALAISPAAQVHHVCIELVYGHDRYKYVSYMVYYRVLYIIYVPGMSFIIATLLHRVGLGRTKFDSQPTLPPVVF